MEESKQSIKAFIIPYEAWYKNMISGNPHIYIGLYYETGGTDGEFKIVWDKIGIRLMAYSDSWEILRNMPELIELMAKIDREESEPTLSEFAELLKEIGFRDITKRENPGIGRVIQNEDTKA